MDESKRDDDEPLKVALKSKTFIFLCLMSFCFMCIIQLILVYPYMISNVVRPFGNLNLDQSFVTDLIVVFPIANGCSRFIWGTLIDYFRFKTLYLSLIIIGVS